MKINLPCLTLAVAAGQASLALGADVPVCSARNRAWSAVLVRVRGRAGKLTRPPGQGQVSAEATNSLFQPSAVTQSLELNA